MSKTGGSGDVKEELVIWPRMDETNEYIWTHAITALIPHVPNLQKAYLTWAEFGSFRQDTLERRVRAAYAQEWNKIGRRQLRLCLYMLASFKRWNDVQDTLGAPGVDANLTCLSGQCERDVAQMVSLWVDCLGIIREEAEKEARLKVALGIAGQGDLDNSQVQGMDIGNGSVTNSPSTPMASSSPLIMSPAHSFDIYDLAGASTETGEDESSGYMFVDQNVSTSTSTTPSPSPVVSGDEEEVEEEESTDYNGNGTKNVLEASLSSSEEDDSDDDSCEEGCNEASFEEQLCPEESRVSAQEGAGNQQ